MVSYGRTERAILTILSDGKPRALREIVEESRLSNKAVGSALRRLWRSESILRTEKTLKETEFSRAEVDSDQI